MTDHDTEVARADYYTHIIHAHLGLSGSAVSRLAREIAEQEAQALQSVRQEENEACAKVAELQHYLKMPEHQNLGFSRGNNSACERIATAIRNRMKEKP